MPRPRILVTCWRRPLPTYLGERTILDTLDPAYAARVFDAGGLPLVVSRPDGDALDDVLALADGLLLTGGGDVDPASYGAELENADEPDRPADEWELALIAAARERGLPTLGICRGAQLLAVAHGGRLGQRVSLADGHRELGGLAPEEILADRHEVTVRPGSRVQRALGAGAVAVNTIHHHEIADAGELEVTATAPGGVIEAVEPRTGWACVGVQWHPEKMHEPSQLGLFAQLVSAACARSGVPA
ncbi:MAG TPA: gamma-glutamyl-gamma-aminobutyrate hydrolase family protein [Solirubrobacteraceae bacterium]|nr:gamma-glutamyl-gamma-aminobutyrate hydrolase family protein [Solirubrobacteraceae bacterium]